MAILLEHNLLGTIVECPQDWNIARKEILGTCIGSSHFAQILSNGCLHWEFLHV
jgi:hypothetical protein